MENISIIDAGIIAVLGYAVVFVGLIALQVVIMGLGKFFISKENAAKAAAAKTAANPAPVAAPAAAAPVEPQYAPGTAGQLKLYDTDPKIAAMIMAIVADKMGKPLNELRFISIKEVK